MPSDLEEDAEAEIGKRRINMGKNQKFAGRWQVIEKIGGGGQATVYKVIDDANPTEVFALKQLKSQKIMERRTRMFNEVSNVKHLDNIHLTSIIDSNCDQYESANIDLYYVSSYIDGCTLEEYCKKNDISFLDALSFWTEMLKVISYCHEKDILHRDIKPDNIILKNNKLSDFVLIDFGLSFNDSEENCQETCTLNDQQLGNRFLLLPELVAGSKDQKRLKCSDISQACGVFYYTLTGIIPNTLVDGEGKKPHQREKAFEIINNKISDRIVFENIISIFDKCFDTKIDKRFRDTNELLKVLETINEPRLTDKGGRIMGNNYQLSQTESGDTFSYAELITILNPTPELFNPAGLKLPQITDINLLVPLAEAVPSKLRDKIVYYYKNNDFETSTEKIWQRAIGVLRARILSLGEDFVADMVGIDNDDYLQHLPPYTLICLAHDLGFINKSGKDKLLYSNQIFNHYSGTDTQDYEEMPQDEANVIIKNCISYILYCNEDNFGWHMSDFRKKLKSSRITDLYDDTDTMFSTSPYFYLKTTVRSLLSLFKETEDIEYENVVENMNLLFPIMWERLEFEERRALADSYEKYHEKNDIVKATALSKILQKVKGFDYVSENTRSRLFANVANRLKFAHFEIDNYHIEPVYAKKLESLGTKIPKLALKECLNAIIYVKIGNSYGISWDAQSYADKILARVTSEQWTTYLEVHMKKETDLIEAIKSNPAMRTRWKELVKEYKLKELNIVDATVKGIL